MATKLTPKRRALMEHIRRCQDSADASVAWWQLDRSDGRIARILFHAGLIEEKTNDHFRRGLRLTEAGAEALDAAEGR